MSKIKELYGNSSREQLLHAREEIEELIQRKTDEEKRLIWRVQDKWLCVGNFSEDNYLLAVECLAKRAKELNEEWRSSTNMGPREMHIEIVSQLVPASEYREFIDD